MLEPSQSKNRIGGAENGMDGELHRRPDISLLDEKQWRFVQRFYQLSPRELQVAKHICQGLDNEEVAKQLRIRSGTVKTHLRNIYRRIRVTNKIGMLLTFVEKVAAIYGRPGICIEAPADNLTHKMSEGTNPPQIDIVNKQTEMQS
jgi:DNA-binding CsgD family transcriptional regulator